LIDPLVDALTPYEELWYDYLKEANYGSPKAVYSVTQKIYDKDPKNIFISSWMASRTFALNRPGQSIQLFELIQPNNVQKETPINSWRYSDYAYVLVRMNNLDEAKNVLNSVPENWAYSSPAIVKMRSYLYVLLNQPDSIYSLIEEME
jgi:hypothetical protein